MKKTNLLRAISSLVFLMGVTAGCLQIFSITDSFTRILFLVSMIYLLTGWLLFKGHLESGHSVLLFFIGYLYASIFFTIYVVFENWPMAEIFSWINPLWVGVLILLIIVYRKKIPYAGLIQFIIESFILLLFSIKILM